jgi:putative membrane protein
MPVVDLGPLGAIVILGVILSALAPVGVIVGAIWAYRRWAETRRDPAEDELRTRFARGEIDEEEFARRLRTLRGPRG